MKKIFKIILSDIVKFSILIVGIPLTFGIVGAAIIGTGYLYLYLTKLYLDIPKNDLINSTLIPGFIIIIFVLLLIVWIQSVVERSKK